MGSGNVKGFALTLLIGVISSLFTAITVTRFLLHALLDMDLTKNIKLYGA
jgi:preprotein translocase subunit SecD